ncbi:hypothetical protein MTR_1g064235 [Medicago truncatula]|uniref:Uncharacterized protein n=1 Tax=Medicago truncatula TaxID=3880 RepID=A0A072VK76_MEDTR|nr:hypothetical protein MTR_1g064235 [Medicago truncatula]
MKNNLEGNKKTKGKTVFKMIPFLSNWMGHGTKNDGTFAMVKSFHNIVAKLNHGNY